ncbi:hypothetical protein HUJ04_006462 [Dendroctonus ponderosae]
MIWSATSPKIALALCFLIVGFCEAVDDPTIVWARIESCAGCSLKRLIQVRDFLNVDVPKYENVEWKKIQGAPPEIIFFNEADQEVEREKLERYTRKECNELLVSKGFQKKKEFKEQIDQEL